MTSATVGCSGNWLNCVFECTEGALVVSNEGNCDLLCLF